ncbi:Transcription factor GTE10 Bromodomain-containing protein [Vigna angularis]|uniref:Transcription factor GTE10 Bromodomain-containing protein n=1 Tax=Phaseolus angularis TaxID=3914 RepID=A0A8T0KJN1_PHAAN|nr:Transcription factor GTE10 Bromodomain-containing protein [Vigna angularis]
MAPTVPIEFAGQKESRKYSHSQNMGKSRKYSKAYATGFVPDFRHAVETMGESEGLGSLGRVDTELTASADSCAPKRKCPGLSTGGYGSFDVPFQLFSLSRMSGFERKDLKTRLTWELEQVKEFQKKVEAINSNALVLSPSSDIRSCSAGQKRPKLESQPLAMEVSVPHGKKRPLPGNSGPRTKKSISGRPELPKPAAPVASHAAMMKPCESLLNRLMTHQFGWVFNTPVDVVKLNIPDYFTVIKHPMDLGTVKRRITSGEYTNLMDFAADVRLTFSNAMTYNPPGNDVHLMADTLHKIFESRWKAIEKKIPVIDCVPSEPSRPTRMETEISDRVPPSKKKKITSNNVKPEPLKIIMTVEEKHKLSVELEAMLGELPDAIVDFLREQSYNAGQTNDDEIEIDIDALSDETLFKLRKLLDDYLLEKQRSQAKAGQCEMELLNESGFSNSPVQPCKGNEQVEEDVDIVGGNDPPISTYPPLEIDKDGTNRNSKCSSSSSSSSESGTSSSDSDSGSSSGSELDMAKTSEPLSGTKVNGMLTVSDVMENVGSGSTLDQNKGDPGNSDTGKDSTNVGGQVEQTSQSKLVASEPESHQEGESAASKRQVSPEKLYRAALLRSRFADTILKAQEKALEKSISVAAKKARLQAEAKAAEEARRKAEAEAAAEAKRKRELEREAARQALQKMEKTVDINESSQFLEDLEMLSAVHDEPMPSFKEETSADLPQNGLGMINLQGNPLEQLGLYMKDDEEEEEEELPLSGAAGPSNDVEEGEID